MALMVDGVLLTETRERVLAWFAEAGRDLPWRATRDPYRVLVAEVLAQQTQAARAAAIAWLAPLLAMIVTFGVPDFFGWVMKLSPASRNLHQTSRLHNIDVASRSALTERKIDAAGF